jgi:hypothetical protein
VNFISKNPQNFSQFPPVKLQFSTLDDYFTARASDIENLEKHKNPHPMQQQNASTDSLTAQASIFNASDPPTPPLFPPGSDFFPYVLTLATQMLLL